jgi:hypothetical protein
MEPDMAGKKDVTFSKHHKLDILNPGELKQAVASDHRVVLAIADLLNSRRGSEIIKAAMSESNHVLRVAQEIEQQEQAMMDVDKSQPEKAPAPVTAPMILTAGAEHIAARAASRDCLGGERSMARTVKAFNAMFGTHLTEVQGWQFMVVLKMARASAGGHNPDDYEDGAAYFALAGEAADGDNREFEKHFGPDKVG